MINKDKAIVLRTVDFSESSLIATLFTRENGMIAVIAKGARKPKSKFAALLVPGQVLEVVYYLKTSREVQTLSEASVWIKLDELRYDIEKMALAQITMELTGQVLHKHEVNKELFDFLVVFLRWLHQQETVSKTLFPYIQLRILEKTGIGLQPGDDLETGDENGGYLNIQTGTLSKTAEGDRSVLLKQSQFSFLKEALYSKKLSILRKNLTNSERSELIEYLDRYLRYHVEGVKPRKSDDIFEKILNP